MTNLPENALTEGVEVDLVFRRIGPTFGDVFTICGEEHPRFRPSGHFDFGRFAGLQFSQCDDYFGVRSLSNEGDDVAVWLIPLIGLIPVHHNPGPFTGLRLAYNVLRNPIRRAEHYLKCLRAFTDGLPVEFLYRTRGAGGLHQVEEDIHTIAQHWLTKGVVVGSHEALIVDY